MARPKAGRQGSDLAFLGINLLILLGAALFLVVSDGVYRRRSTAETLRDSRFLTTEWRLMRELKERTDRELRDKDQEITDLRLRYLALKGSGSSTELLASIAVEMRRAEAEREAILSARLKAVAGPSPATAPVAQGRIPDTALSELLRSRIVGLEDSLRASRAGEAAIELELARLRATMALEAVVPAVQPAPSPGPGPVLTPASLGTGGSGAGAGAGLEAQDRGEADRLIKELGASLARERDALGNPDTVLGLSELKTRALLRAIVRTPAIRSEYPDLLESLDRYLVLAGKEEYLRGRREAYGEIIGMIEGLRGAQGK